MSSAAAASTGGGGSTGQGQASTGGGQAGSTGVVVAGWGDDWRTRMAQGSTDTERDVKRLERFESPELVYKSFRELESKMSKGELRPTLRKDATSAEVAQYRKDMGIPEAPEGYKINMPAGRQAPKEDDAFLKSFLKSAHDHNYSQAQVDGALGTFYAEVDKAQGDIEVGEKKMAEATEDQLRKEWGADYRPNKAMAEALLARAPAGFRDRFMNGYLVEKDAAGGPAKHTPIRASADAWKWLVQMEREINPAATILPGVGGDVGKTIEGELTDLKKLMANKNSDYWTGPKAEQHQARYRELLGAQEKLKAKAA